MIRIACFLHVWLGAFAGVIAASWQDEAPEFSNFKAIFNGQDLSGWEGDSRLWSVRDGVLRGETTESNVAKGNTFLIWNGGSQTNFVLRVTFRCNATNNSGIQYRSKHITDSSASNAWVLRGYQHELRNEIEFPDVSGFIYDEGGKRGRICLAGEKGAWGTDGKTVLGIVLSEDEFKSTFKLNDWNEVLIVANGNNIRHYMNGKLILDFTENEPRLTLSEGVIGLQLHAGKPMWVEFKDIQLGVLE